MLHRQGEGHALAQNQDSSVYCTSGVLAGGAAILGGRVFGAIVPASALSASHVVAYSLFVVLLGGPKRSSGGLA